MNSGEIAALATGIPAVLAAITALVTALKAHGKSSVTEAKLQSHLDNVSSVAPAKVAPSEHLMP